MKKTLKRFLTTVLSAAMVIGMFVGSEMRVLAANYDWDSTNAGMEFQEGDTFTFPDLMHNRQVVYCKNDADPTSVEPEDIIRTEDSGGFQYSVASINGITTWVVMCKWYNADTYKLYLKEKVSTPTTPSTDEEVKHEHSSDEGSAHQHSFSWVTVQEAGAGQDGIEEYRCSCGAVEGRQVIPGAQAVVHNLCNELSSKLKEAPQKGVVEVDTDWLYTLSDIMIKILSERTDVTTVLTFNYQKTPYKMTIPAGADFTTLLADEDHFYGYFYFAQQVGATIETIQ